MQKHLTIKTLKYTTINRYYKKRIYKRKATRLIKAMAYFSYTLSFSTFFKKKQAQNINLNSKMLKILVTSEPTSFSLLNLILLI